MIFVVPVSRYHPGKVEVYDKDGQPIHEPDQGVERGLQLFEDFNKEMSATTEADVAPRRCSRGSSRRRQRRSQTYDLHNDVRQARLLVWPPLLGRIAGFGGGAGGGGGAWTPNAGVSDLPSGFAEENPSR